MTLWKALGFVVVGTGVSVVAQAAVAGEMSGTGHNANQNISTEVTELADGSSLMRIHDASVIMGDNEGNPFHLTSLDCFSTFVVPAGADNGNGTGYCHGVDQEGDLWWITFSGDFGGGTWDFTGGTGKFEGIAGGGGYKAAVALEGGRSLSTWDGTWTMK